ncbi:MAG: hypothetical protein M3Z84_07450 [Actinomycetota bacterium]|nr:hypothetical protein [Actinomycetota bacterium]
MEKLRNHPGLLAGRQVVPLIVGQLVERRCAPLLGKENVEQVLRIAGDLPGVDVDRPVDVGGDVPLGDLGLFVQLAESFPAPLVVPREQASARLATRCKGSSAAAGGFTPGG